MPGITKFAFIVSSYNSKQFVERNLDSIRQQNYPYYRVIYVNDCSSDGSLNALRAYQARHPRFPMTLLTNRDRRWPAFSRHRAYQLCHDEEVCVFLDGDDFLATPSCLRVLKRVYDRGGTLATFGSMVGNEWQFKLWKEYRRHEVNYYPHLRTAKAKVVKRVPVNYLKDAQGQWLHVCTDVALFTAVAELVGPRRYQFLKDRLVIYNRYNYENNIREGFKAQDERHQKIREEIQQHLRQLKPLMRETF
jgi:glycosyltransferase involved in cell wall biosynthesis